MIGGATQSYEDTQNKAIVLGGELLMGFTGFARFDQSPTDEWVVERLASYPRTEWLSALARESEAAVARIPGLTPERRGHAYAAVGFTNGPSGPSTLPTLLELSNSLGEDGHGWIPGPGFRMQVRGPSRTTPCLLRPYGIVP